MTTVFVTGASGKIGMELTKRLLDRGYSVVALVRNRAKLPLENKNLVIVEADILDTGKYIDDIRNCDYVFHLAVYQNPADPKIEEFVRVNVDGTRAILDALVKSKKLKRFIYVSTVMVFEPTGKKERSEEWPKLTSGAGNNYVETKLVALKSVDEYAQRIPIITLYPSIVIDKDEIIQTKEEPNINWHNVIRKVIGGGVPGVVMSMFGDKDRMMNFVFLSNLIEAMINTMHNGKIGGNYILGGQNITVGKYIREIERIKKRKFLPIRIPLGLLKLVSIQPPVEICFSSKRAVSDLGLKIDKLSDY